MVNWQYKTDCFFNQSDGNGTGNISQAWSNRQYVEAKDQAFRIYQGWMVLPVVSVALPLTLLYIAASARAIHAHRVSRKFHVLLVNRALGDLLACLVALISAVYFLLAEHANSDWAQFLNSFFTSCFWSALVTYTSIGFLKLYAVARPLQYKEVATMRRCVLLVKLSWLFFALIMLATMGFTLVTKIDSLADWSGCKVETCLSYMYKVRNVFTIALYFLTLIFFVITVGLIKKAKRISGTLRAGGANLKKKQQQKQRSDSVTPRHRFRFPLIKLILGVSTFAVFHFPYAVWNVGLLFASHCYFILHYNLMQTLLGFIRLFVLIRIILDALIGFYTDNELRHQLRRLLHIPAATTTPSSSEASAQRPGVKLSTTASSLESASADGESGRVRAQQQQQQKRTTSAKMATKTEAMEMCEVPRKHSHAVAILERIDERSSTAGEG